MKRSSVVASVFLILFALPFVGTGLAFMYSALSRGGPQAWLGEIFGLFFVCIGVGLILLVIAGFRTLRQQSAAKAADPDKPWLWRKDWAEGRANGSDPRANVAAWVFTLIWDFVSGFLAVSLLPKLLRDGDLKAVLVAIFPAAAIVITAFTLRGTLRVWRYGRTWFQCDTLPFSPGNRVRGLIHLKPPSATPHGIDLRLSCKRRIVTGSGKSQSVNELVLWQEEKNIPAEAVMRGLPDAQIPVEFTIPAAVYETNEENPNDRVSWQLHAQADVPGADYSDNYELPVFRSGTSAFEATAKSDQSLTSRAEDENPAPAPENTRVVFSDDGRGPRFYFPPMRNRAQALGVFGFAVVWSAVVYLLWAHPDSPWLFRIGFSVFELLIVYMVLNTFFGSALVMVREGTLQVRNAILGIGALRKLPFADVNSVSVSSQGRPNASGELLYGIVVNPNFGNRINIAASSLTQTEARWVVSTLERAMGRKQDTQVEFQGMYGPPPQRGVAGTGK